jgi:DNA gyrase subunit A
MEIGTVRQIDIQDEMQGAYLDYAMSVIVSRALPDARDGLKPVHRRILFAMHDMGLSHDKPYRKSARIVGEVLGKYHPHGDTAVYDAMVRMAQDFSLRYTLVDGQGNFGSIDGDSPAAMRYTEARLHQMAREMLADIDKDTIDFVPNFDGSLQEPSVMPSALPNLLINGASGIAVGMATNIPPHNLGEVCNALCYLIDHFDKVDEITVEDLMQFIKGPDFPTAGILYRYDGNGDDAEDVIARAYASGRGRFRVQARTHIEEMSRNRKRIVVTELPYQVNKTRLIERTADLARDEKIEGITDLRDESDRTGMRIVIELTRNVDPKSVLADLYKYTPMQQTFGMSMLALVNGEPRLLSLRRALLHHLEHRREVIRRRSAYELKRAKERAHVVEGLLKALDILDQVIQTIRRSRTTDSARGNLMRNFKFSQVQAQAILDMPLKRLAALERKRLQDEYKELRKRITYLEALLASPRRILSVIKEELLELKERYGDPRRTRIVKSGASAQSLTVRDMLADEPVMVLLGRKGLVRRESMVERRRGKLPSKVDRGAPLAMAVGRSLDDALIFSADGRMGRAAVHRLKEGSEMHPADLGLFRRSDRLVSVLLLPKMQANADQEGYLVLATREGRVKRVAVSDARTTVNVAKAMNVEDGDELVGVATSDGSAEIMLVTKLGQAIRFQEADVRPMGLPAAGVWGIKLSSGDEVVRVCVTRPDAELVLATTSGYFKRTPLKQFSIQRRHGSGLVAIRLGQRSGAVADAQVALPGDEFFSASRNGTLRRLEYQEIPSGGRSTLGRLLIQPAKNDMIADLLTIPTARPRRSAAQSTDGAGATGATAKRGRSRAKKSTRSSQSGTTSRSRSGISTKRPTGGKGGKATPQARSGTAAKPATAAKATSESVQQLSLLDKLRSVK